MDFLVVFSGGMDSTVLIKHLISQAYSIQAISFNYGSKHNNQELVMAKAFCQENKIKHNIVSLSFINELFESNLLKSGRDVPIGHYEEKNMKNTLVPFRNGIMLSIAAGLAQSLNIRKVALASHRGDHFIYPDCRPEFNQAFTKAVYLGTGEIVVIEFPFAQMDKREIGDLGRKLGVNFVNTWTCYKGGYIHCGVCGACHERKYALRFDQGLDPTAYES